MAGVNRDCNQECIWNAPGTGCIKPDSIVCEIEERGKRMKTEILKIKGDWQEVVDDCRATVGKQELGKEPSEEFKRAILISEHSPYINHTKHTFYSEIYNKRGINEN